MASAASATFPVTTACFNTNTVDARKSSFFEFKPLNRSNKVIKIVVDNTLINITFKSHG